MELDWKVKDRIVGLLKNRSNAKFMFDRFKIEFKE